MGATPTAPTPEVGRPAWVVRRQPHPESPGLADLVDDVARFRSVDVYRRPAVTAPANRRDPRRFADPATLWSDLLGRSARRPTFRLVADGATTDPAAVTRRARIGDRDLADLAAPNRVIDRYRAGATVVLQGLHLTDPGLARFANNLALELDHPVQVNAYLSPGAARGLDVHFDYHDVFVVQLEGTKRWRVWSPTDGARDPVAGKHRLPRPDPAELGEPAIDLVLAAGDVLYLPRGHPHVAETTDRSSAHLTVGLLAVTWHRVARRAIDAAVDAGALRSSVPLSLLALDPAAAEPTTDHAARSLPPDLGDLDLDLGSLDVRRWLAEEIWHRQAATRLRPLDPPDPATVDGPLAVAPGPLLALHHADGRSHLFVGDRTLSMPDEAHPFLTALLSGDDPFRRAGLPGLDDASSRVVVGRLLDEGILVPAEVGPSR